MRDTFVNTLIELAKKDSNIELITGDLGFGVLKPFWEQLPNQFTNAGIAEQNMTSVAAGMAMTGKKVIIYSIGNFPTLRCLEQIRNDCAYHDANVKIVCVGGGLVYGSLGMSHQATEDIAILRSLPNVTVFATGDYMEAEAATKAMMEHEGTCYLRLGRGGEKKIHDKIENFEIGKAIKVSEGKTVAILSTGAIYDEVQEACDILKESGINPSIYTFPTVSPIDEETICLLSRTHEVIVTCEEHNLNAGFGGAVAEVMADNNLAARLLRIAIDNKYVSDVGNQKYLRQCCDIDAKSIAEKIQKAINE